MSDIPNPLQPFPCLPANMVELVKQYRARSSSEEPLERRGAAKDLPVRPVHEMLEHLAKRGLPAVRVLAGQLEARRYGELSVDMGEAGPQRRDHRNVRLHRHVLRNDTLDQAGRSELGTVERMGRTIARVGWGRWWLRGPVVVGGLDQDRLNVPFRFSVSL